MKKYEVVVILDPQKVEGTGEIFSNQFQAAMEKLGAKTTRTKFFELRTFTHAIGKHKAGLYWDYVVEAEGTFVAAIKDAYRLEQTVLRMAVFEYTDGQDDDVFTARPEHDALIREENFADAFDEHSFHDNDR